MDGEPAVVPMTMERTSVGWFRESLALTVTELAVKNNGDHSLRTISQSALDGYRLSLGPVAHVHPQVYLPIGVLDSRL